MPAGKKPLPSPKPRPSRTGVVRKAKSPPATPSKPPPAPNNAPTPPETPPTGPLPEIVTRCLHALEEKKAEAIRTLDVRGKSSLADFLLIATGNSDTHLRALRIAVEKELDAMHAIIVGRETQPDSGWCVVDAFDVIVHLFRRDQRDTYDLEKLWLNSPLRPLR